jgi:hypothetical protein
VFSFFHEFLFLLRPTSCPETNADETQTNGADVKVNGTNTSDGHESVTSQKYSQILGDHHTNSSTQFSRNSSLHIKSRNGYNKENFYNQRSGRQTGSGQRSWQRGGNYRTSIVNGRDKKPEEGEKADVNVDSTAEPKKFNEGESQPVEIFHCSLMKFLSLLTKFISAPISTNM